VVVRMVAVCQVWCYGRLIYGRGDARWAIEEWHRSAVPISSLRHYFLLLTAPVEK
jgi:hypothetical protein